MTRRSVAFAIIVYSEMVNPQIDFGVHLNSVLRKKACHKILDRLRIFQIRTDQFVFGRTFEIRETFSIGSKALE